MSLSRIVALFRSANGFRRNFSSFSSVRVNNNDPNHQHSTTMYKNAVPFMFRVNRKYSTSTIEGTEPVQRGEEAGESSKIKVKAQLEELTAANNLTIANLETVLAQCRKEHDFETALQALQVARETEIELTSEIYSQALASGMYEIKYYEIRELFGELINSSEKEVERTHTKNFEGLK